MSFFTPFLLIRWDGQTTEFGDLISLACAVREARIEISRYHVIENDYNLNKPIYNEWIVRDSLGQIVPKEAVWDAAPCRIAGYRRSRGRLNEIQHAVMLGLPIPHTGRRHVHMNYLRQMRTVRTNRERAGALVDNREAEVRPKGQIDPRPTSWDDISRSLTRSWKAYRRTQWRS